jgi:hypothetical protein
MLKSFPTIFTVIGCPKKSDFDQYYLIICHILENRQIISQNLSKSAFLGHPMTVKMVGKDFSIHSYANQTHFVS